MLLITSMMEFVCDDPLSYTLCYLEGHNSPYLLVFPLTLYHLITTVTPSCPPMDPCFFVVYGVGTLTSLSRTSSTSYSTLDFLLSWIGQFPFTTHVTRSFFPHTCIHRFSLPTQFLDLQETLVCNSRLILFIVFYFDDFTYPSTSRNIRYYSLTLNITYLLLLVISQNSLN